MLNFSEEIQFILLTSTARHIGQMAMLMFKRTHHNILYMSMVGNMKGEHNKDTRNSHTPYHRSFKGVVTLQTFACPFTVP